VDVWALGATLFYGFAGRFPLLGLKEPIPRVSEPERRTEFERELARRAQYEWDERINIMSVPVEFRPLLQGMLNREPQDRPKSAEVFSAVVERFPAFIRGAAEKAQRGGRFSPSEELEQLADYIESLSNRSLLPPQMRARLKGRLQELENTQGFLEGDRQRSRELVRALS